MTWSVRRILVPVDFSELSRAAALAAAELGARFGAPLELLHVWRPPPLRPDLMVWAESDGVSLWQYARQRAEEEMRELVEQLKLGSQDMSLILAGEPATTIVDHANAEGFDLIVMGTRGRGGLGHLLIGSVAEKVVRHAPCPVLTIRAT